MLRQLADFLLICLNLCYRGGWAHFKCYLNVLLLILEFHVTLNSLNAKLKTYGVHWGLLDIYIALHVSLMTMYFVF